MNRDRILTLLEEVRDGATTPERAATNHNRAQSLKWQPREHIAKTREEFRQRMPKKMRRLANRNALLAKLVDSEVKCLDGLEFSEPRTKDFKAMLAALGVDRTCLALLVNAYRERF